MNDQINNSIRCFITAPFKCSYLPARLASNIVVDPNLGINNILLGDLLEHGFRRSGKHLYRPQCQNCSECISIRVQTKRFIPNRSQRRNWHKNSSLRYCATRPVFNDEQFALYCKYMANRHDDSEMNNPTPTDYIGFLTAEGISVVFHEFRLENKLLAITVADHTVNSLSAVYTFFDPDYKHLGLGSYAILWLIRHAQENNLPWVYLGYWIKDCAKMSYKSHFSPQQGYVNGHWQELDNKSGRS